MPLDLKIIKARLDALKVGCAKTKPRKRPLSKKEEERRQKRSDEEAQSMIDQYFPDGIPD